MSLYVYHSNPAAIAPDQNAVIRGLEREDLFTVVHERFLTDTARYADIVLPATSSLEHPDLYRCYGSYQAQRCGAAIPPVGEAKSNWEVFCLLAAGMGWDEPFFRLSADELVELLLVEETPWRSASRHRTAAAGGAGHADSADRAEEGMADPLGEDRDSERAGSRAVAAPAPDPCRAGRLSAAPAAGDHAVCSQFELL